MIKVLMTAIVSLSFFGSFAMAHDMNGMLNKDMTKEQRANLADHFETMAKCLRSDKTMKECHEEAEKHCKEAGDKCPMNGMMHDHGMKQSKEKKAEKAEKK